MKIVIADDEPLVRVSLNSMIQEMETSWEIVGEAAQGEEMLELLAEHQPEVAIVDIRMPKLDGLEAIRQGKAVSPRTRWIILSGFSDFQYAQQALRLGVDEYLLKPVVPDELEKALHSVSIQNREYAYLLNCQFENRLISLIHGLTSPAAEPEDSLLRTGHFQAFVFIPLRERGASHRAGRHGDQDGRPRPPGPDPRRGLTRPQWAAAFQSGPMPVATSRPTEIG